VSYIDQNLLPGERVVYRARLHRLVYTLPAIFAALALVFIFLPGDVAPWLAAIFGVLALVSFVVTHITWSSTEFGVTDMRVIAKTGWLQRDTSETLLSKVEAIGVDQTVLGRLLGFGTVHITGTGGTRETFRKISRPLELRRQIQAQIVAAEERRSRAGLAAPSGPREERECPWCAERILVKARVCKHCGREVPAP
jgi:uncharacterized membrane protein YdbT with pleckstrin-like domain